MFDSVWQIISNTPWWVFVILALLIWLGISAFKTRILPVRSLLILPIILILLSLDSLVFSLWPLVVYVVTLALGIWIGFSLVKRLKLRVDRTNHLIEIPGTWTTLVLTLVIFAAKYYFGYTLATQPALRENTLFHSVMLGVSGLFTGYFIGRLIGYLVRLRRGPQTPLK